MIRHLPIPLAAVGFILVIIPLSQGVSNGLSILGLAIMFTAGGIQFAIERHES